MNHAVTSLQDREFSFSKEEFRFLATLANQRTGIVLAEQKRDMIYGRLVRRLRALKLDSFAAYCELLQSEEGESEIGNLINAVTTNLTHFFREAHHFEHLKNTVLPECGNRVRIWSAGCSSGMEPYSIAMTLQAGLKPAQRDAKILATDIDSNMLATGAAGSYTGDEYENIPAAYRQHVEHYPRDRRMEMKDSLKQMIAFKHLNLLEGWPMKGPFDAVFCRNVVIYFDKPTKQQLFARMAELIKPDGWLYIGHSENLHGVTDRFQLVGRTIYRRVK